MKKLARRLKYYMISLFRMKKGARQISLGLVVGFFPCWFPTFGIGPALSVGLTKLMRGNIPSAIIAASIGSFVWPLLFYMNYISGNLLDLNTLNATDYADEFGETAPIVHSLSDFGIDFTAGAVINSVIFTVGGYFLFHFIFSRYRRQILSWLRSANKHRAALRQTKCDM